LPFASERGAIEVEDAAPERGPATDDPAVKVDGLSVTYRTTYERRPTLKRRLARLGRRRRAVREIEALKNVSFEIAHGRVVGVVGVSGAGKSTLMRTIAGIVPPTEGRVEVNGRISTLLALGVGFNRRLTGRENIVLGGLAAGFTRDEIEDKFDEIAEFAELGDLIDAPVRAYSSGMSGRLAFSVAVHMDPDILLIDEALSVGDARFRRKSFEKMRELCSRAHTVLMVSHALRSLRERCSEVIWLHDGRVAMWDDPETVINAYTRYLDVGENEIGLEDV
jgi:ABC-type polysaccharide/polyol phosphate transport system ATPase subunit